MTCLMDWLYTHHIKPYIETCEKDDGDKFRLSLIETGLDTNQMEDFKKAVAFHATHGFKLGLKLGLALAEDLKGPS